MLASGFVGLQDPTPLDSGFMKLPDATVLKRGARSSGTRVVPVFVMSLAAGAQEGMLLDDDELVAASRDAVLVLQSLGPPAARKNGTRGGAGAQRGHLTRFAAGGELVRVRGDQVLRHAVAGVGVALSGLASPTERHSQLHGRRTEEWVWGAGHHPFGPFSNCSGFSELQLDVAQRNSVLTRVDTGLRTVRGALAEVEAFTSEYLSAPFGRRLGVELPEDTWLDYLYHDKERPGVPTPLPHALVARLEQEMDGLETSFVELGEALYNRDLAQAHVLSSTVLRSVTDFATLVGAELADARAALRCCRVEHAPPAKSSAWTYFALLALGVVVYAAVIAASKPRKGRRF